MPNVPAAVSSLGIDGYQTFTSSQMRDYLIERLKKLSNWDEIDQVLNTSGTLDLIIDLISSATEINSFYNLRSQQESYLEFAQVDENIFSRSRELGYRISRHSAPAVVVRYNAEPTIELRRGDVLGTFGNYDLVFFLNESKMIEKGDLIPLVVGKYKEQTRHFSNSETGDINLELEPEELLSIDNNNVVLLYDSEEQEKTLFPEDYIVYNKWCDFSSSQTTSTVQAANYDLHYGLVDIFDKGISDSFTVKYMETDGDLNAIISESDVTLEDNYLFYNCGSTGYTCDTTTDIVKNAPLMYSLQRRAVTENDYKFLMCSLPQFYDAAVTPYNGQLGTYDIYLDSEPVVGGNYWIMINEITYAYNNTSEEATHDDIIRVLYEYLKDSELVKVGLMGEEGSTYIRIVALSPKLLLSVACNNELLTRVLVQDQVLPSQCTLHVHYVSTDTVYTPYQLTAYEYSNQIAPVVDQYKMVGLTLFYEHAELVELSLLYIVTLEDAEDKALVDSIIESVILEYDRHIDIVIDSTYIGNTIVHHANFKYGRTIISNLTDNKKLTYYVDKYHYCKISYEIIYVY